MGPPPESFHSSKRRNETKFEPPPEVGSIVSGRVVRIEDYGAFVQLDNMRYRGLVHISQLAQQRLESVTDAVSMDETVWVKVLEVTPEENPVDGRPPRFKIRLSMKDAAQDGSGQDLGALQDAKNQVSQQLEQSLNSQIGMGMARDPMAHASNIVLKQSLQTKQLFNGYSLVDDTEGKPPAPEPSKEPFSEPPPAVAPMGRGRGTTLPAWMTQQGSGLTKKTNSRHNDDDERRRKKKKRKKEKKNHRSKRHYSDDEDDDSRRRHDRKKRSRRRERSESSGSDSDSDRRGHSRRRRQYYSSGSDSDRRSRKHHHRSKDDDVEFESKEEALKLIRDIEARQRGDD